MKIVNEFPKSNAGMLAPHEEKYPFDDFFTGEIVLLEADTDFKVTPGSMSTNCYGAAKRRGISIRVAVRPEGVYVQKISDTRRPPKKGKKHPK